ncbi:MAG: DUF1295 domain-containing protein [Lacipirellulaceae bacterium]
MTPSLLLLIGFVAAMLLMTGLWFIQRKTGNAGIVDVAWAGAVGDLGVLYALFGTAPRSLRWLVGGMIAVWSIRLTSYLYVRVVGEPEEGRYKQLREDWGENANRNLLFFYWFQAAGAWVFALPAFVIAHGAWPALPLVGLAVSMWILGIGGVALSDWQLKKFKQDPDSKGKTCRRGLWRYSRHPNYFFEWIHWCSYIPLSLASGYWWVTTLVALSLLYLILFKTGIPPTEKQALKSRGEDYREYQRTTNAFVPWFPKE